MDLNGIPSTYACAMMSWLHEEPMAEHLAVEFWSGSTPLLEDYELGDFT